MVEEMNAKRPFVPAHIHSMNTATNDPLCTTSALYAIDSTTLKHFSMAVEDYSNLVTHYTYCAMH